MDNQQAAKLRVEIKRLVRKYFQDNPPPVGKVSHVEINGNHIECTVQIPIPVFIVEEEP